MSDVLIKKRILKDHLAKLIILAISIIVVVPLVLILGYLIINGLASINLDFITNIPKPVGETGGGILNAILGSGIIILTALILFVPLGIGGGIYVSEFSDTLLSRILRLSIDVLQGTPSIVIGIFTWVICVVPMGRFSALSGSLALGVMVLPIVLKSTEETLKLIPMELREAATALGVPYYRVVLKVVVPAGLKGIASGVLLGTTRISGETAPLLFTAFGNPYMSFNILKPMSSLPLVIYVYATSPYDEWHKLAWGASLILILLVFGINMAARIFFSRRDGR